MKGEGDKRDKAQVGRTEGEQGSGEMGGIKEERKKEGGEKRERDQGYGEMD